MKKLLAVILSFVCAVSFGQFTRLAIPVSPLLSDSAMLKLPSTYSSDGGLKYELFIFCHGAGEGGTSLSNIYNSSTAGGPFYYINLGTMPNAFWNPVASDSEKIIFLSPQSNASAPNQSAQAAAQQSFTAAQLDSILTYMIANYRVDTNRIIISGLSAGGETTFDYPGHFYSNAVLNCTPFFPSHIPSAVIPMSADIGASCSGNSIQQLLGDSLYKYKVGLWAFGDPINDVHGADTKGVTYFYNLDSNSSTFTSYSGGHCCWNEYGYDPSVRYTINGFNSDIYEWSLTQKRTASSTTLTVSAGGNQSLQLPDDSTILYGVATPGTGYTITSYTWVQVSGPNTATLTGTTTATLTAKGLISGTYVFSLTASDNSPLTHTDNATITVNAEVPPTVNAGSNQSIYLPTTTTTITGTAAGNGGATISTTLWTQTSGASATITSPSALSTGVTGLSSTGTYIFKLTATDNNGNSAYAYMNVVVNPIPGGVRRTIIPGGDGGIYYDGNSNTYNPGDTLVLNCAYSPYAYVALVNVHGTASKPVVVINDSCGVALVRSIGTTNCTYMHLTGTGSPSYTYGIEVYTPAQTSVGVQFSGRSAWIEQDHFYIHNTQYGYWLKQPEDANDECADSLIYPNWWLHDFSIHNNDIDTTGSEGFYAGSTNSNGQRYVICSGDTTYPVPMHLGNINIFNNIISHTGRAGIQLSGADSGVSKIYGNIVSYSGEQHDPAQGNNIALGGYTKAWVYNNTCTNAYCSNIQVYGIALDSIFNNITDSAGHLAPGYDNPDYSSVSCDVRPTFRDTPTYPLPMIPQYYLTVKVVNNQFGTNTYYGVRLDNTNSAWWNTDNLICGNTNLHGGGPATYSVASGVLGTFSSACSGLISPPVLTVSGSATVDNPFSLTFTDDAGWRSSVTSVLINNTVVSSGVYTLSAGTLTLSPGATTLLQSPGTPLITIRATGYIDDTITQPLASGAATALKVPTQPASPSVNGGTLSVQPIVHLIDKYSNNTSGSGTVVASAGAGAWTIGGTTSITSSNGKFTFTNLTATSSSTVTGATISFLFSGLPAKASQSFNIPSPSHAPPVIVPFDSFTLRTTSVSVTGNATSNDGTITTWAWSQISGPTEGVIQSPSGQTTVINHMIYAGKYVYRLTVTDSFGNTTYSDVTITVKSTCDL